jgi:hypothetical protein
MKIYIQLVKKTKRTRSKSSQKNLLDISIPNMERDLLDVRIWVN